MPGQRGTGSRTCGEGWAVRRAMRQRGRGGRPALSGLWGASADYRRNTAAAQAVRRSTAEGLPPELSRGKIGRDAAARHGAGEAQGRKRAAARRRNRGRPEGRGACSSAAGSTARKYCAPDGTGNAVPSAGAGQGVPLRQFPSRRNIMPLPSCRTWSGTGPCRFWCGKCAPAPNERRFCPRRLHAD